MVKMGAGASGEGMRLNDGLNPSSRKPARRSGDGWGTLPDYKTHAWHPLRSRPDVPKPNRLNHHNLCFKLSSFMSVGSRVRSRPGIGPERTGRLSVWVPELHDGKAAKAGKFPTGKLLYQLLIEFWTINRNVVSDKKIKKKSVPFITATSTGKKPMVVHRLRTRGKVGKREQLSEVGWHRDEGSLHKITNEGKDGDHGTWNFITFDHLCLSCGQMHLSGQFAVREYRERLGIVSHQGKMSNSGSTDGSDYQEYIRLSSGEKGVDGPVTRA